MKLRNLLLGIAATSLFSSAAIAVEPRPFPVLTYQQQSYLRDIVFQTLAAEKPDYGILEKFNRELSEKTANYQAHERATGLLYWHLGVVFITHRGMEHFAAWRAKYPNSPIPLLAMATAKFDQAAGDFNLGLAEDWIWHPPGANTATEIEQVRRDLQSFKETSSKDPYWYILMAKTLIALRRDVSELDALVEEGLKKHPSNFELVQIATVARLSKWGGNAEQLEDWAQKILRLSPPADKSANYARIYNVALRAQYGVQLFDLSKLDWPKLMRSVRDLVEIHPSEQHLNEAAVLACAGGNRKLTREMLQNSKFEYSDVYWYAVGTQYHPYQICRAWAGQEQADFNGKGRPVPTANP